MSVDELSALIPPPGRSGVTIVWGEVENALGGPLPDDYKKIIELYGPGSFLDFIHIFQPGGDYPALRLIEQAPVNIDTLRYLRDQGEVVPYNIDVNPRLLSCGRTDNGDILYWVRNEMESPNEWPVAINASRDDRWFEFPGGIASLLSGLILQTVVVPMFPASLYRRRATFQQY